MTRQGDEWGTPIEIIEAVRMVLGVIDLDPASSSAHASRVAARQIYTSNDNGLIHPWNGRIFLNPPFSSILLKFVTKLIAEIDAHNTTAACVITDVITDTRAGQILLRRADAICFTSGRIAFIQPDGTIAGKGMRGQMITFFGSDTSRFLDVFSKFGKVFLNIVR